MTLPMPFSDTLLDEVHELTLACLSGNARPETVAILDKLVCENDAALCIYVDAVLDSSILRRRVATVQEFNTSSDWHELDVSLPPSVITDIDAIVATPLSGISEDQPHGRTPTVSYPPTFLSTAYHGTIGFFSQELPFSLLIATLLTGFGLWIASLVYVSSPEKIAQDSSPPVQSSFDPTLEVVGKITGMVDVRWSDINTSTETGHGVLLGRKYALATGLMEITYDTGAKVILQGPVTYEVESRNSGFLSVGKLTGKVEVEKAKGFSVRTPTAVVTDLGTEFGVEVQRNGQCELQVFQGAVEAVTQRDGKPFGQPHKVTEGQTAKISASRAASSQAAEIVVDTRPTNDNRFVCDIRQFLASRIISVNFTDHGVSSLDPVEKTGVVQAGHWNNIDASPNPPPTITLHNAAGHPTTAAISWQWSGNPPEPSWSCSPNNDKMIWMGPSKPQGGFEKLFDGIFQGSFLERRDGGLSIRVTGIPFTRYRVYVYYYLPPTGKPKDVHTFGLSVNGGRQIIVRCSPYVFNGFYRYRGESNSGNFAVFDDLAGDLTVAGSTAGDGKYHALFIAGLQIVETPSSEKP